MNPTLRFAQRHAAVAYLFVAAAALAWMLSPGFTAAVAGATWVIAQGVGIVWIGSGAWAGRERWAIRAQITFVGAAIIAITHIQQATDVAAAGLVVFMVAVVFLHIAHITGQALHTIQGSVVTVPAFARLEAARQNLFYATFAVPVALAVAPGPIGVAFVIISCLAVSHLVGKRARRRLTNGLAKIETT